MPIYSSTFGQMGIGIDGRRLKISQNLSYDENKFAIVFAVL